MTSTLSTATKSHISSRSTENDSEEVCAISGQRVQNAWTDPDGNVYEFQSVEWWWGELGNSVSPVTKKPLSRNDLRPRSPRLEIQKRKDQLVHRKVTWFDPYPEWWRFKFQLRSKSFPASLALLLITATNILCGKSPWPPSPRADGDHNDDDDDASAASPCFVCGILPPLSAAKRSFHEHSEEKKGNEEIEKRTNSTPACVACTSLEYYLSAMSRGDSGPKVESCQEPRESEVSSDSADSPPQEYVVFKTENTDDRELHPIATKGDKFLLFLSCLETALEKEVDPQQQAFFKSIVELREAFETLLDGVEALVSPTVDDGTQECIDGHAVLDFDRSCLVIVPSPSASDRRTTENVERTLLTVPLADLELTREVRISASGDALLLASLDEIADEQQVVLLADDAKKLHSCLSVLGRINRLHDYYCHGVNVARSSVSSNANTGKHDDDDDDDDDDTCKRNLEHWRLANEILLLCLQNAPKENFPKLQGSMSTDQSNGASIDAASKTRDQFVRVAYDLDPSGRLLSQIWSGSGVIVAPFQKVYQTIADIRKSRNQAALPIPQRGQIPLPKRFSAQKSSKGSEHDDGRKKDSTSTITSDGLVHLVQRHGLDRLHYFRYNDLWFLEFHFEEADLKLLKDGGVDFQTELRESLQGQIDMTKRTCSGSPIWASVNDLPGSVPNQMEIVYFERGSVMVYAVVGAACLLGVGGLALSHQVQETKEEERDNEKSLREGVSRLFATPKKPSASKNRMKRVRAEHFPGIASDMQPQGGDDDDDDDNDTEATSVITEATGANNPRAANPREMVESAECYADIIHEEGEQFLKLLYHPSRGIRGAESGKVRRLLLARMWMHHLSNLLEDWCLDEVIDGLRNYKRGTQRSLKFPHPLRLRKRGENSYEWGQRKLSSVRSKLQALVALPDPPSSALQSAKEALQKAIRRKLFSTMARAHKAGRLMAALADKSVMGFDVLMEPEAPSILERNAAQVRNFLLQQGVNAVAEVWGERIQNFGVQAFRWALVGAAGAVAAL